MKQNKTKIYVFSIWQQRKMQNFIQEISESDEIFFLKYIIMKM